MKHCPESDIILIQHSAATTLIQLAALEDVKDEKYQDILCLPLE